MGLFDKKNCSICGKEIGFLGTVKLEDGVICKSCSGKLSPFFTGRKKTTVNEIKEQLAYRAKNAEELKTFNPDVIIGEGTRLYQESGTGRFAVSKYSDWRSHNPDVIARSKVNNCDIEVREHKDEIYDKNEAGERVSFDPPQYRFTYEFLVKIGVESPYFSDIKYELTDSNHRPEGRNSQAYAKAAEDCRRIQTALLPDKFSGGGDVVFSVDIQGTDSSAGQPVTSGAAANSGEWKCECGHVNNDAKFCVACGKPRPVRWFCPECGKENYGSFCANCGRKKPE